MSPLYGILRFKKYFAMLLNYLFRLIQKTFSLCNYQKLSIMPKSITPKSSHFTQFLKFKNFKPKKVGSIFIKPYQPRLYGYPRSSMVCLPLMNILSKGPCQMSYNCVPFIKKLIVAIGPFSCSIPFARDTLVRLGSTSIRVPSGFNVIVP